MPQTMSSADKLREILSTIEKLEDYSFELGPIRPPSEGGRSLLIRVTRNCPWRLCTFCYGNPYNHEKFQRRTIEEVKKDISNIKSIFELLKTISLKLGCS